MSALVFAALLATVAPISVDKDAKSVTFTATSTDCGIDAQIEFLFVGPNSDHGYESMFTTDANISEFVRAFEEIGLPVGAPVDMNNCSFWPVGNDLVLEPSFEQLVRETTKEPVPSVIYTGGTRDVKGMPEAETNMPSAVFALYNCPQSLLQLNDTLDQSATYGRFKPAEKIPLGERRTFKLTWKGTRDYESVDLKLSAENLSESFRSLREKSAAKALVVKPDFDPEMTIQSAQAAANALSLLDSVRVKINGFKDGQFFYRAYMPLEKWRDRKERLAQPPEVHFKSDGSFVVTEIKEDWSDEAALDPKLIVKDHAFSSLEEAVRKTSDLVGKTDTVLVFASASTKLAKLYELRGKMSVPVHSWYIFAEGE